MGVAPTDLIEETVVPRPLAEIVLFGSGLIVQQTACNQLKQRLTRRVSPLPGALKDLTRLTELNLTVGKSLDAFEGDEELFGVIAGLPALRILHMNVRAPGYIRAHSPAVVRFLTGALSGLKELTGLNLACHKFCLAGAISLVNALQSLAGLTYLRMGVLKETFPAGIGGLTALREINLSYCESLKELPAELGALKKL
jgi:hypothetical protein